MTDHLDRVTHATAARKKAEAKEVDAIVDALRADVRQADLVRVTGYSREHIRRLARAHGIEPKPRGQNQ